MNEHKITTMDAIHLISDRGRVKYGLPPRQGASMKLIVTMYRTATFPSNQLTANLKPCKGAELTTPFDIQAAITERFGVLAPRFRIWLQPKKSVAGMEVMSFDVQVEDVPQAGLITANPIDPKEIARIDGALRSELERLGIQACRIDEYDWRLNYVTKGN